MHAEVMIMVSHTWVHFLGLDSQLYWLNSLICLIQQRYNRHTSSECQQHQQTCSHRYCHMISSPLSARLHGAATQLSFDMQPPSSQQQRVSEAMSRLPSIATSKSHHLPNGKHPQAHAQSLPGTPTEPNQQDSSSGAAGSSRKSPSTMMRPRSTQVLLPETLRYGTSNSFMHVNFALQCTCRVCYADRILPCC